MGRYFWSLVTSRLNTYLNDTIHFSKDGSFFFNEELQNLMHKWAHCKISWQTALLLRPILTFQKPISLSRGKVKNSAGHVSSIFCERPIVVGRTSSSSNNNNHRSLRRYQSCAGFKYSLRIINTSGLISLADGQRPQLIGGSSSGCGFKQSLSAK